MTDAPERASPRFPEARVPFVRTRVQEILERQGRPLQGVSSAARGGDLIFLETLLQLGGAATVRLPFPVLAFKQISVGAGWEASFDRVLAHASITVPAPLHDRLPEAIDAQNAAFEACNAWIVEELAAQAAAADDPDPLLLAVFHSTAVQRVGGTWDAIERWQKQGRRVELIDPLG